MKVCFDVNAIVYLYTSAPQQAEVLFAYDVALTRGFQTVMAASSLADTHYVLRKCGLKGEALETAMDALFQMSDIFDCTGQDGMNAHHSDMADYEDALIAESALRNGVDVILTYNVKDFENSPVAAQLPADFIRAFKPASVEYAEVKL